MEQFTSRPRDDFTSVNSFLSRSNTMQYSSNVLVGNWFNERIQYTDPDQAIVPAICTKTACVNAKSLYKDSYLDPQEISMVDKSTKEGQAKVRFLNKERNMNSNIKLFDGRSFLRNFTTTQDIFFRLSPAQDENRGEPKQKQNERKLQNEDPMRSYGNETNFGLREWKDYIERQQDNMARSHLSTYNDMFRVPKMQPVKRSTTKQVVIR